MHYINSLTEHGEKLDHGEKTGLVEAEGFED